MFIHWPKSYLLLSVACDEKLSWMIKNWMENCLVSDSNCNTVNLYSPKNIYKGMTSNVGLSFSVGDTILWFTISIEQDN